MSQLKSVREKHVLSDDGEALSMIPMIEEHENAVTGSDRSEIVVGSGLDGVPQWFAAYTTSRHEKAVAGHFAQRKIEAFLPLYRTMRSWKNGCKVNVELPLFPSYIFVRVPRRDRVGVLQVPGVLSLVSNAGKPVPLPTAEIDALRAAIPIINCEPHPYLVVGERARIKSGPLMGMQGVLLRKKNFLRVVLSLDLITQSVAVEVDADNVEPVAIDNKRYALS